MAKKEVKNIEDLIFDKRNANKHSQFGMARLEKSINKIGLGRSILISADNEIIAGNGVTESAINAGIKKVRVIETTGDEIIAIKRTDIKSGTKEFYEMALSDNIIAKENIIMDAEVTNAICEEFEIEEYKIAEDEPEQDNQDETYSTKIESPIYTPKKNKPNEDNLFNLEKYTNLIENIDKFELSDKEKIFLKLAATRHIIFDYSEIAEFYAHSEKDVQELMEQSALIIIDYNKAIDLGFVKLYNQLTELRNE